MNIEHSDPYDLLSLYQAFLEDPTQRTVRHPDDNPSDDNPGSNFMREFIARLRIGRRLEYDSRFMMENIGYYGVVPETLQQQVSLAFRLLPTFPHRHLFKYAANKLCLWEGQITNPYRLQYDVTLAQVMLLANLYHRMLVFTGGRMYQFCREHMDVEICLVVAQRLNVPLGRAFPGLFQDNGIIIE